MVILLYSNLLRKLILIIFTSQDHHQGGRTSDCPGSSFERIQRMKQLLIFLLFLQLCLSRHNKDGVESSVSRHLRTWHNKGGLRKTRDIDDSFFDTYHLPKFNHTLVNDRGIQREEDGKNKEDLVGSNTGGAEDEERLFAKLFEVPTYDKAVRPVLKKSDPVQVILGIAYVQLIGLDEREQTLKSSVWIRQTWKNEVLTWDPEEYGGIEKLTVTKELLWVPDLILYGSTGTSGLVQGLVESSLTKIEITHEGNHKWYTPVILTSSCSVDIQYFPFDNQKCVLRFGSWTHASDNINLTAADDKADTAFYLPSSDFEILGIPSRRHVVQYSQDLAPFTDISFEIYLQRLPGYYVFNVIIPSVAIAILGLCVFAYPEDNSGRVGFVLACFLSLVVVAMMIASAMPVSSDSTPLISLFMLLGMFEITLAGIINVIVLVFYKEARSEVPNWLRNLCFKGLAPLVRVEVDFEQFEKNKQNRTGKRRMHRSYQIIPAPGPSRSLDSRYIRRYQNQDSDESVELLDTRQPEEAILTNFADYKGRFDEEYEGQFTKDFWKCVSDVVDRLFFTAFVIAWLISIAVVCAKIPDRSEKAIA